MERFLSHPHRLGPCPCKPGTMGQVSYRALKNPIVWIDCEMTGLDPEVDELVEIAVIITDSDLNPLAEGIDRNAQPPHRQCLCAKKTHRKFSMSGPFRRPARHGGSRTLVLP